ncbi:MAG: hypothetical protein B7Z55_09075 [Planctomycetales bacterium 12-60-4]|nr:MAG: hypothetical protein B7Z55_09075 [Planctomycetales bacterium 12-60-4]
MTAGSPRDCSIPGQMESRMSVDRSPPNADAVAALEAELLVSAAAHDLKAPLVTIQGFLSGLEAAARAGDWDRFASDSQRIQRACGRMRQVLDDLRDFTKQRQPLEHVAEVSLADVVDDALEQLAGVQPQRIEIVIASDLPRVGGDRVRLMRVVQNVLENAFRSVSEQDYPRVEISALADDRQITLTIRDNGGGVDPSSIPRMFQPYRQLGGKPGDCGLGLSTAQRIMRAHGGELTLESAGIGTGATVRLVFPAPHVVNP